MKQNTHLLRLIEDLKAELRYQRRDIAAHRGFYLMLRCRDMGPLEPWERFINDCEENTARLEMRIEELSKLVEV